MAIRFTRRAAPTAGTGEVIHGEIPRTTGEPLTNPIATLQQTLGVISAELMSKDLARITDEDGLAELIELDGVDYSGLSSQLYAELPELVEARVTELLAKEQLPVVLREKLLGGESEYAFDALWADTHGHQTNPARRIRQSLQSMHAAILRIKAEQASSDIAEAVLDALPLDLTPRYMGIDALQATASQILSSALDIVPYVPPEYADLGVQDAYRADYDKAFRLQYEPLHKRVTKLVAKYDEITAPEYILQQWRRRAIEIIDAVAGPFIRAHFADVSGQYASDIERSTGDVVANLKTERDVIRRAEHGNRRPTKEQLRAERAPRPIPAVNAGAIALSNEIVHPTLSVDATRLELIHTLEEDAEITESIQADIRTMDAGERQLYFERYYAILDAIQYDREPRVIRGAIKAFERRFFRSGLTPLIKSHFLSWSHATGAEPAVNIGLELAVTTHKKGEVKNPHKFFERTVELLKQPYVDMPLAAELVGHIAHAPIPIWGDEVRATAVRTLGDVADILGRMPGSTTWNEYAALCYALVPYGADSPDTYVAAVASLVDSVKGKLDIENAIRALSGLASAPNDPLLSGMAENLFEQIESALDGPTPPRFDVGGLLRVYALHGREKWVPAALPRSVFKSLKHMNRTERRIANMLHGSLQNTRIGLQVEPPQVLFGFDTDIIVKSPGSNELVVNVELDGPDHLIQSAHMRDIRRDEALRRLYPELRILRVPIISGEHGDEYYARQIQTELIRIAGGA